MDPEISAQLLNGAILLLAAGVGWAIRHFTGIKPGGASIEETVREILKKYLQDNFLAPATRPPEMIQAQAPGAAQEGQSQEQPYIEILYRIRPPVIVPASIPAESQTQG